MQRVAPDPCPRGWGYHCAPGKVTLAAQPRAGSSPTLKPDSLLRSTSPVLLTQTRPDSVEAVGRAQGVGVVSSQDPAGAGEGVLGELAGLLILPQLPQGDGEKVGREQSVGMVVA